MTSKHVVSMVVAAWLCAGCGASNAPPGNGEPATVRFAVREDSTGAEEFLAVTTRASLLDTIHSQVSRPEDQRQLFIIGPIARAPEGENLSWHWRFVADSWDLAEVATEVCDGMPHMVEEDIDTWVDSVKRFCPWASFVKRLE